MSKEKKEELKKLERMFQVANNRYQNSPEFDRNVLRPKMDHLRKRILTLREEVK